MFANEAQLTCNLEQSVAEVQASVLGAPVAFASVGDTATSEKNLAVGISQSFSGRSRAALLRDAAAAKCGAIRSTVELDEHGRWSIAIIKRDAAQAELLKIDEALAAAQTNLAALDPQLAAQTITITQHTEARSVVASLEARQAELRRRIAAVVPVQPPLRSNIATLLEESRENTARAARLAALSQADAGWDVVVSAGARQPVGGHNNSASLFATVTLKYSLGAPAAAAAARDVGRQTGLMLAAQGGGYTQTIVRQREELLGLVKAETEAVASVLRQIAHLKRIRATVAGIDTALAKNTTRMLDLQLFSLDADRAGSEVRLSGYQQLLEKLQ